MHVCFVAPIFCWSRNVLHRPCTFVKNLKSTLSASGDSDPITALAYDVARNTGLPDCDCPGPPVERKGHQSTSHPLNMKSIETNGYKPWPGENMSEIVWGEINPSGQGFNSFAANLLQSEMCSDIYLAKVVYPTQNINKHHISSSADCCTKRFVI